MAMQFVTVIVQGAAAADRLHHALPGTTVEVATPRETMLQVPAYTWEFAVTGRVDMLALVEVLTHTVVLENLVSCSTHKVE